MSSSPPARPSRAGRFSWMLAGMLLTGCGSAPEGTTGLPESSPAPAAVLISPRTFIAAPDSNYDVLRAVVLDAAGRVIPGEQVKWDTRQQPYELELDSITGAVNFHPYTWSTGWTITARSRSNPALADSVIVQSLRYPFIITIGPQPTPSDAVSSPPFMIVGTVAVGDSIPMHAVGWILNGIPHSGPLWDSIGVSQRFRWRTSAPGIATISPTGELTGRAAGRVSVIAEMTLNPRIVNDVLVHDRVLQDSVAVTVR